MSIALSEALVKLKESTSPEAYQTALKTMHTYCNNVCEKPTGACHCHYVPERLDVKASHCINDAEEKFRRVRIENGAFQKRVGVHPGGLDAMRFVSS